MLGVWFGFVRFALLLAVILCLVDRCFASWELLGFFCLLRVTQEGPHQTMTSKRGRDSCIHIHIHIHAAATRCLEGSVSPCNTQPQRLRLLLYETTMPAPPW